PTAPPDAPAAETPATAEPSATAAPAVDELDATAVRRIWDDVLEVAKRLKRRTHALLLSGPAQVVDVRTNVLVLGFASGPVERQFNTGDNADVLREALKEVLGVDWRIETTLSGQAAADADIAAGVAPPPPPSPSEAMAADRAPSRRPATAARTSGGAPRSTAAEAAAHSVANPPPAAAIVLDEAHADDDDADDGGPE
ncbi:MAG: polymerase subunit gamma/tau, partial [Actinomycetota bacterium]|nr:polymerase subunit gamma/tau [Actinomycetota bacterium]